MVPTAFMLCANKMKGKMYKFLNNISNTSFENCPKDKTVKFILCAKKTPPLTTVFHSSYILLCIFGHNYTIVIYYNPTSRTLGLSI